MSSEEKNETVPDQVSTVSKFEFFDPDPNWRDPEMLEILNVIKILENALVPCCLMGVSALKYYFAGRIRFDWELCVPVEMVDVTVSLLKSELGDIFEPAQAASTCLFTMYHTFPRFKHKEKPHPNFVICSSDDYHFEINSSTVERSHNDLPYPKVEAFAQSLLDLHDLVSLTDLIDGMNLTIEWGEQHLDLDGTQDLLWAERKNEEVRRLILDPDESCWFERNTKPFSRRETWVEIVTTKERRLGEECPKEVWATRFRGHNDEGFMQQCKEYY